MKPFRKLTAVISIFTFSMLAACGANQIDEANNLVAEANQKLVESDQLVKKTEKKNKELFAVFIKTNEDLQEYKQEMSAKAKGIVKDYERASDLAENAADKFAEAGKLNVPENYKTYLETKAEELAKRSEAVEARKENAQAFLDYDDATMIKKFEENNEKSEKLMTEAKELGKKADKIKEENGNIYFAETRVK